MVNPYLHIVPDFFSAFFMFPFGFEAKEFKNIRKLFSGSQKWKAEDYKVKNGLDYNEYIYFYEHIREILFCPHDSKNNRETDKPSYFKIDYKEKDIFYEVENTKIERPQCVSLKLQNIYLHLFETGVGVLIFEIIDDQSKHKHKYTLSDYLFFLCNGRRVYVPFINPDAKGEDCFKSAFKRENAIEKGECASRIRIKEGDKNLVLEEDFQKSLMEVTQRHKINTEKLSSQIPVLGKNITYFLDINKTTEDVCFKYEKSAYWPLIDDRMFIHSFYSIPKAHNKKPHSRFNKEFLERLKYFLNENTLEFKFSQKLQEIKQVADVWYQLIHIDRSFPTCQNDYLLKKILGESSYNRWSNWGTFYGYSRFSSVMITDIKEAGFLYNHFKTMYYQIAILLFFYRGTLLSFSSRSKDLAREIKKYKNDNFDQIFKDLKGLNQDFIFFRNTYWFREVTAQDQGIEIFDLWSSKLRNRELFEDIQTEINGLYSYMDAVLEKDTARKIDTITILGGIFIPFSIVASLFGMNLYFVNNDLFGCFPKWLKILGSIVIFIIASLIVYRVTQHLYHYLVNKDDKKEKDQFPSIFKLIIVSLMSLRSFFTWIKTNDKQEIKNFVFFLGGHDAEMCEIRNILETRNIPFFDKQLAWGAKASVYEKEIAQLDSIQIPVLIELEIDFPLSPRTVIIDHHGKEAGRGKPTSIEQVAHLLSMELNHWQKLIAANDRAWIDGLIGVGAAQEEIDKIRRYDRLCQGVTEEEETAAEEAIKRLEKYKNLAVVYFRYIHTSPVMDRLYKKYLNIIVFTPESANFSGNGKCVMKLAREFPGGWYGGDLPNKGFWGINQKDQKELDKIINVIRRIV